MSCTVLIASVADQAYSASTGETGGAPVNACTQIIYADQGVVHISSGVEASDMSTTSCVGLPESLSFGGGGDYPSFRFVLLIDSDGSALLVANADGVAGTADDRKLFLV